MRKRSYGDLEGAFEAAPELVGVAGRARRPAAAAGAPGPGRAAVVQRASCYLKWPDQAGGLPGVTFADRRRWIFGATAPDGERGCDAHR